MKARGIHGFKSDQHGDISFRKDEVINNVKITTDNYWIGTCRGETGYFPRNFVEVYDLIHY